MQFDTSQLADLLQQQGQGDQAQQLLEKLPGQVDTEQHAGVLQDIGLDPEDLAQKAIGGGLGNLI